MFSSYKVFFSYFSLWQFFSFKFSHELDQTVDRHFIFISFLFSLFYRYFSFYCLPKCSLDKKKIIFCDFIFLHVFPHLIYITLVNVYLLCSHSNPFITNIPFTYTLYILSLVFCLFLSLSQSPSRFPFPALQNTFFLNSPTSVTQVSFRWFSFSTRSIFSSLGPSLYHVKRPLTVLQPFIPNVCQLLGQVYKSDEYWFQYRLVLFSLTKKLLKTPVYIVLNRLGIWVGGTVLSL